MSETFVISDETFRDAIYAGIWTRLCCELRGPAQGHHLFEYIDHHSEGRNDPEKLFKYLDEDTEALVRARQQLRDVKRTELGETVQVEDVERFMPKAWKKATDSSGPGRWLYTGSEADEIEREDPSLIDRVSDHGSRSEGPRNANWW